MQYKPPENKNPRAGNAGAISRKNKQFRSYKNRRKGQEKFTIIKKDYARLNQAALNYLPRLLKTLGVSFCEERHEAVMLNPHRPDTHYGSFRINRRTGRWGDFAVHDVRGSDAVSLIAYLLQVRQSEAAQWIYRALGGHHD